MQGFQCEILGFFRDGEIMSTADTPKIHGEVEPRRQKRSFSNFPLWYFCIHRNIYIYINSIYIYMFQRFLLGKVVVWTDLKKSRKKNCQKMMFLTLFLGIRDLNPSGGIFQ